MRPIADLASLLDQYTLSLGNGSHETAIANLHIMRAEAVTEPLHAVFKPSLCIVAQGAKRTVAGERTFDYAPGQYLTVSISVPVRGQIMEAAPEAPFLCMKLTLDPLVLNAVVIEGMVPRQEAEPEIGLQVSPVSPEIIDAAVRLVGLLGRPEHAGALAPLYQRELMVLLLSGPQGARLRQMAMPGSRTAQIVRALRWITENFRQPISVEDAAAEAGMSASTFYQHFKNVTSQSPLQFQKQLRLQEARSLLVSGGMDAASASFAVGYSSPQQFSREYARMFGAPPQRDAARLRSQVNAPTAAAAG